MGLTADDTIGVRWHGLEVMVALDDARAGPLLDRLFADVQASATEITDAAERDRVIPARPAWRAIVAAHARRNPAP